MTGIVRDSSFLAHDPGPGHPDRPDRLAAVYAMLDGLEMAGRFVPIPALPATPEQLLRVHDEAYVRRVAATQDRPPVIIGAETLTSPGSYEAALRAAGGLCGAVDAVLTGEVFNAFALVRPPGHHAERDRAMGFCLFNNAAVAAAHARAGAGVERVLIVDWDVHHGNGTQHAFEEDPSVVVFSTHQWPHYPGTGGLDEVGRGPGLGATVNVPLAPHRGDADYAVVYREILAPIAGSFRPDLILVSAGFDGHRDERLSAMELTARGFAALTRVLEDLAGELCGGRLVLTLEGGYDPQALVESVRAVLLELLGDTVTNPPDLPPSAHARSAVSNARFVYRRYWPCLG